jgi:hypothetical protein
MAKVDFSVGDAPLYMASNSSANTEGKSLCQSRIGFINGQITIVNEILQRAGCDLSKTLTHRAEEVDAHLMMLHAERLDFMVLPLNIIKHYNQRRGFDFKYSEPPIYTAKLYVTLHERHAGLIPLLTKNLASSFKKHGLSLSTPTDQYERDK